MKKILLPLLLSIAACSSSSKPKGPVTTPLVINATDRFTKAPLAGVYLALDDATSVRQEAQTDATGAYTFQVDWKQAPMALTAYGSGHQMVSYLGIPQPSPLPTSAKPATFGVVLDPNTAAPGWTVTGKLLNKPAGADVVTISPSIQGGSFQNITSTYSLTVYDNQPFSMFVLDWVVGGTQMPTKRGIAQTFNKWVQVDAPMPSPAATVDIDFNTATALTPVDTTGTMTIPGGATGPLATSTAYVSVSDSDSSFSSFLGAPQFIDVATDPGQFTFNLEHVEPASITKPVTSFIIVAKTGATAAKNDAAWPSTGAVTDLLDIPAVTTPATGAMLPLGQAPEFTAPAALGTDGVTFMQILLDGGSANSQAVWTVYSITPGTPLATPALPSAVDPAVALPTGPLSGQIVACSTPTAEFCALYSLSDRFPISR